MNFRKGQSATTYAVPRGHLLGVKHAYPKTCVVPTDIPIYPASDPVRLKPAQASVIRLMKLQGGSIEGASGATGQSVALVKVNIYRGLLKKLAALVACDAITPAMSANSSKPPKLSSNRNYSNRFSAHRLHNSAAD
jgi:hypothetical protein